MGQEYSTPLFYDCYWAEIIVLHFVKVVVWARSISRHCNQALLRLCILHATVSILYARTLGTGRVLLQILTSVHESAMFNLGLVFNNNVGSYKTHTA
jgi:hypothetical protein